LSNNLGWVLYEEGAYAEAESLLRFAAAGLAKTLGEKHEVTGLAFSGLAYTLQGLGDVRGAESAAREALAVFRQRPADTSVVGTLGALGAALLAQQRVDEALPILREARDILEAHALLRKRWFKPYIQGALGAALAAKGEASEAEGMLIAGYEGLRDLRSAPRAHVRDAVQRLVAFYTTSGRTAEAVAWRNRLAALGPAGE
jgi:tetratricopeptide (TPR) repeat protein